MMEHTRKCSRILGVDEETVSAVRALYGLDAPGRMNEAVGILDTWIKQQPHFRKKDFPPRYLETTIINSKGSIETAKTKIDRYCTMKNEAPEYFEKCNARRDFYEMHKFVDICMCPKFIKNYYRLHIVKVYNYPPTTELISDCLKYEINVLEHCKSQDYMNGVVAIVDYSESNISEIITKLNVIDLHKASNLYLKAFGLRLFQLHIIYPSKIIDLLVGLLKQTIKKMGDRIYVHADYESLYKFIPKEILPSTFGGNEKSVKELAEALKDDLSTEEHTAFMLSMQDARTDEKYRPKGSFDDQNFNMQGTFRTLNID